MTLHVRVMLCLGFHWPQDLIRRAFALDTLSNEVFFYVSSKRLSFTQFQAIALWPGFLCSVLGEGAARTTLKRVCCQHKPWIAQDPNNE